MKLVCPRREPGRGEGGKNTGIKKKKLFNGNTVKLLARALVIKVILEILQRNEAKIITIPDKTYQKCHAEEFHR
jgi:hypothetical protein